MNAMGTLGTFQKNLHARMQELHTPEEELKGITVESHKSHSLADLDKILGYRKGGGAVGVMAGRGKRKNTASLHKLYPQS